MLPNESYMKRLHIQSRAIRHAARNEECAVEILGVCNGRVDTTVLAHFPDESRGAGRKPDDISAGFCCSACHDVIDGRAPWPDEFEERYREWYFRRAQTRTIRRLVELGVVSIKGVK